MKRSSDFSSAQQSMQWSYGSNEIDLSSPLATTPSQANPTKKRCPSATLRSEAANTRFSEDLVGFAGAELVSPTTRNAGVSRQSSSAAPDHPLACEVPSCTKVFKTPANLRYVPRESEPSASGLLNNALDITQTRTTKRRRPRKSVPLAVMASAILKMSSGTSGRNTHSKTFVSNAGSAENSSREEITLTDIFPSALVLQPLLLQALDRVIAAATAKHKELVACWSNSPSRARHVLTSTSDFDLVPFEGCDLVSTALFPAPT
jgi:hypothetical protein